MLSCHSCLDYYSSMGQMTMRLVLCHPSTYNCLYHCHLKVPCSLSSNVPCYWNIYYMSISWMISIQLLWILDNFKTRSYALKSCTNEYKWYHCVHILSVIYLWSSYSKPERSNQPILCTLEFYAEKVYVNVPYHFSS